MESRIKQLSAHFPTAAAASTLKHINLTIKDRVAHLEMFSDKKYLMHTNAMLAELDSLLLQLEK